ncbi:MAG: TfoX/Sxy family protein [Saprospiraceae bacterium]|nr:TfoX/Sxy family protein [Saprospiraceae bacterium]
MSSPSDFFEYVQDQLSSWNHIDKKRMFGVLGLYRDSLMFGIIAKDIVYLKVDDSNIDKYIDAGSTSLKVFKNNSEVPSYYKLPEEVLENAESFIEWAQESYAIQVKRNS